MTELRHSTPAAWDPQQYDRFAAERAQPFVDLVGLVRKSPAGTAVRVVDLGCGTGELTATLAERLGACDVLGVDHAPAMLEAAASHAGRRAGATVRFEHGDIAAWHDPGRWDVVVSNAALQWIGDHETVLACWTDSLTGGGQLAVQMPSNADHPSHVIAAEVAAEAPFADAFAAAGRAGPPVDPVAANVQPPAAYAELLHRLGFAEQHVRLQVYGHMLASTADVVEWTKGTTLTRFKRDLTAELFDQLVDRYRQRLVAELGDHRPYFYPFKRVLLWGRWAGEAGVKPC